MQTPVKEAMPHLMGPAPFIFVPGKGSSQPGPAFSKTFKALATALVLGGAVALVQAWMDSRIASVGKGGGWFIAGLLLMAVTWWFILRSTTRIEAHHLHQTWVWNKQMDLRDLAYGKLIRVRGLEWLIAPRLYVRSLMGKFAVFYAASPAMIGEFERLVSELRAFRRQQ